ncbi:MAG: hypothetical protein HQL67_06510 [Magnetococcales bacterium]|nr:hypothetical protein [Magnetococcales bacterium]
MMPSLYRFLVGLLLLLLMSGCFLNQSNKKPVDKSQLNIDKRKAAQVTKSVYNQEKIRPLINDAVGLAENLQEILAGNTYPDPSVSEITHLDLHRYLNNFNKIEVIPYPQQTHSAKQLLIVEERHEGMEENGRIENGYYVVDAEQLKKNLSFKPGGPDKKLLKTEYSSDERGDILGLIYRNPVILDMVSVLSPDYIRTNRHHKNEQLKRVHDLLAPMVLTKGLIIEGTEDDAANSSKHVKFRGYLHEADVFMEFWGGEKEGARQNCSDDDTLEQSEEADEVTETVGGRKLIAEVVRCTKFYLSKQKKQGDSVPGLIVSASSSVGGTGMEHIQGIIKKSENALDDKVDITGQVKSTPEALMLNVEERDNSIILVALQNSVDSENDLFEVGGIADSFENLKKWLPNMLFVSASGFTNNGQKKSLLENVCQRQMNDPIPAGQEAPQHPLSYNKVRCHMSGKIDFFTVLSANYNLIPKSVNPLNTGLSSKSENIVFNADPAYDRLHRVSGGNTALPYTSYATPVLASVIYNLWSLYPALTSSEIKTILKESAHNRSEQGSTVFNVTGNVVNPEGAYLYAIGKMLSEGVSHLYKQCKNKTANYDDKTRSWSVDCDGSAEGDLALMERIAKRKKDFFERVFEDRTNIFSSSLKRSQGIQGGSLESHRMDANLSQRINLKTIRISDLEVDFRPDHIQVMYTKFFESGRYKDTTRKIAIIKFDSQGTPRVVRDHPIHFVER